MEVVRPMEAERDGTVRSERAHRVQYVKEALTSDDLIRAAFGFCWTGRWTEKSGINRDQYPDEGEEQACRAVHLLGRPLTPLSAQSP